MSDEAHVIVSFKSGYYFSKLLKFLQGADRRGTLVFTPEGIAYDTASHIKEDAERSKLHLIQFMIFAGKIDEYQYVSDRPSLRFVMDIKEVSSLLKNQKKKNSTATLALIGDPDAPSLRIWQTRDTDPLPSINSVPSCELPFDDTEILIRPPPFPGDMNQPNCMISGKALKESVSTIPSEFSNIRVRVYPKGIIIHNAARTRRPFTRPFGRIDPDEVNAVANGECFSADGEDILSDEVICTFTFPAKLIKQIAGLNTLSVEPSIAVYGAPNYPLLLLRTNISTYGDIDVYLRKESKR